jgi:hypothetical protein
VKYLQQVKVICKTKWVMANLATQMDFVETNHLKISIFSAKSFVLKSINN